MDAIVPFTEWARFAIQESTRFVSPPAVAAEWVITVSALALGGWLPQSRLYPIRNAFVRLAARRKRCVALCGLIPIVARLALLPWIPVPDPSIHDEFSHLLLADTLAHGRLANPTHPMWRHFETIHVIQKPTYSSMYPPAQDSLLALGQVVFHSPWAGVVMSVGLMCAAACWMMQGWLRPSWALYGALILILKIGVQGFWMNSFIGGAVPAIAGALLLGCVGRLRNQTGSALLGILLGLSLALLMNTRPFEGGILAAAALLFVLPKLWLSGARLLVPAAAVLACGVLFTCYYNYRVTGKPTRMGYQVNRDTYGWPENLAFLPAKKVEIEDPVIRSMYIKEVNHRNIYANAQSLLDNLCTRLFDNWTFLIGPLLTVPLLFLPWFATSPATLPLVIAIGLYLALNLLQMVLYPFHLGPIVPAIYAVLSAGVAHMWSRGQSYVAILPLCLVLVGVMKQDARQLQLPLSYWEIAAEPHRDPRAEVNQWLSERPGKQLVIVHYSPQHNPDQEWVYNNADIDGSKVVWARSRGEAEDRKLVAYFHDREAWTINADVYPPRLLPYQP